MLFILDLYMDLVKLLEGMLWPIWLIPETNLFICVLWFNFHLQSGFQPIPSYQLVERFNGRLPGYMGHGNDKFSFCHVDDVVDGFLSALHKGQPGGRYLLTGENASFNQVLDTAATITNTRKPWFNIPLFVIEVYGWLGVLIYRITGKLPMISPSVFPFSYSIILQYCQPYPTVELDVAILTIYVRWVSLGCGQGCKSR